MAVALKSLESAQAEISAAPGVRVGLDTSALDLGFKSHAQRGIGRYVRELKGYFDSLEPGASAVGYFDHSTLKFEAGLLALCDKLSKLLPLGRTTLRQQLLYPLKLDSKATAQFDVVHFPAHMDAPAWSRKPYIITVLDLIPLILSDLYAARRPSWRFHLARWLELRAIKNASLILAISENTARDVERLLGVPGERIVVTPLGVDSKFFGVAALGQNEEFELRMRFGIPEQSPIILYVGGIDPRKNYSALLHSLARLRAHWRGGNPPVLVMAGNIQGDEEFPKLRALQHELGLGPALVMPGFVRDEDLLKLYAITAAFHFPSLYEGFGLPPLEAMAAGVPVVCSNTSSMPEVVGDCAIALDPKDSAAQADALLGLLANPERAAALRERGRKRARGFTWVRTGELTLNAYQRFVR